MNFDVLWKYGKWVGLILLMVLGAVVWIWFRPKRRTLKEGEPAIPPVPPVLLEAVQKAHEEALTARVQASVKAEARKEELQEISKIDNGKERRARLAAMLKKQ